MAKTNRSTTPFFSSTESYKRDGKLVVTGYDDAEFWFRVDFEAPQHFHNRADRDAALEAAFAPVARPIQIDPKISAALDAMFAAYAALINSSKDAYSFYAASAEFAKRQQQAAQTITYRTMMLEVA